MSSIGEIKGEFENASRQEWPALYEKYGSDSRSGVQKLCVGLMKWDGDRLPVR